MSLFFQVRYLLNDLLKPSFLRNRFEDFLENHLFCSSAYNIPTRIELQSGFQKRPFHSVLNIFA